ncbi:MAG: flagellar protein FlgN [Spirochaetaceae bacterium]|jgi:hypothetical protein|nr:flagellar protein FlgN [Spirochaetaceae bacterium]
MITVIAEKAVPGDPANRGFGAVSPDSPGDKAGPGPGRLPGGELSPGEMSRRVAILRRFRELLVAQRNRFRDYIEVLDKQRDVIEQGSPENLLSHVEMEEQIVGDIFSIRKVIEPLEAMYRAAYPADPPGFPSGNTKGITDLTETADSGSPGEIAGLKAALEDLKAEAALRLDRNRELLSQRMTEIRSEIKNLRGNPFAARPSIYAGSGSPSLIDISG